MLSRTRTAITGTTEPFQSARQTTTLCKTTTQAVRSGGNFGLLVTKPTSKAQSAACHYRQGDLQAPATTTCTATNPVVSTPVVSVGTQQRRAQLQVIGLGLRGISAVNRLIGSETLPEAEFWALDSDKRVLSTADPASRLLEVGPGDDACLSQADLTALSGAVTSTSAPEAPDGHAGAVFVLGSAFGSPGGAPMLLQLVRHMRRQGYFVAAALTRPFDFEGARRLEAADTLISVMEEVAHLVVVIAQGVLTRASSELTMGQAEAIADNTLVYTVQSTMWALRAPEVLKVSHGAFLWHGRDLRTIRRPLFPPMMNLLSCPGHATLGRGQAALPLPLLQQAGLASALSTLAEDAIKAAAESPFLDNKLNSATGVLCVLRVPPSALGVNPTAAGGRGSRGGGGGGGGNDVNISIGGPLVVDNHKEYALRSAVQVAAITVRELVGPHCHDIIVCPQLCHELEEVEDRSIGDTDTTQQQSDGPASGGAGNASVPADGGASAPEGPGSARVPRAVFQGDSTGLLRQATRVGLAAPLVRIEVSLLVLERVDEAAEAKAIVGHKSSCDAASNSYPAAAAATLAHIASPSPAAAMARDRMNSVIGMRAISAPRRLPPPGAPTTASSFFSGQLPQSRGASTASAPVAGSSAGSSATSSQEPSWNGIVDGVPGRIATAATSFSLLPPGYAAGGTGDAAPQTKATAAATAAAAETNKARKQARLAAMSALAGGTPLGAVSSGSATIHGHAVAGGSRVDMNTSARSSATSIWASGLSARGYIPPKQLVAGQQPTAVPPEVMPEAGGMFGLQQIPRMAENLQVTSLVAQSLDLPPQAARWRHQQRTPPHPVRSAAFQLPKVDADIREADESWLDGITASGQGEGLGRGLQQLIMSMRLPGLAAGGGDGSQQASGVGAGGLAAVRSRVAGMLDLERKDLSEGGM